MSDEIKTLNRACDALSEAAGICAAMDVAEEFRAARDGLLALVRTRLPAGVAALHQRVAELESEVVELRQINNALMIDQAECSHENIELPEPQDEHGRRAQYAARVRCPDCGEDVEVR